MTRIPKSIKFKARQKGREVFDTMLYLEGKGNATGVQISAKEYMCETGSKVYKFLEHWDAVEITIRGKERRK